MYVISVVYSLMLLTPNKFLFVCMDTFWEKERRKIRNVYIYILFFMWILLYYSYTIYLNWTVQFVSCSSEHVMSVIINRLVQLKIIINSQVLYISFLFITFFVCYPSWKNFLCGKLCNNGMTYKIALNLINFKIYFLKESFSSHHFFGKKIF